MDRLAQGVAYLQKANQTLRQCLYDGDLKRKPAIADLAGESAAMVKKRADALGKADNRRAKAWRGVGFGERGHVGAGGAEHVKRNIDPIEIAIIVAAVLQVVDDLQGRAQRVVRGPGGLAFAMHIEHEAADRHRGKAAIGDQVLEIGVAPLGYIEAEGGEEVLGMAWRQAVFGKCRAQGKAVRLAVGAGFEQTLFELIEMVQLVGLAERRVVGDVVGDAHELVEREDDPAMAWMNELRGDGKVFVAGSLARAQIGSAFIHFVSSPAPARLNRGRLTRR